MSGKNRKPDHILYALFVIVVLSACSRSDNREPPELVFIQDSFEPFETYAGWCTLDHQLFFIRSLFLELYHWGDEIDDFDPRIGNRDTFDYFYDDLVSDDLIAPDRLKDPWSFITLSRSFDDFLDFGREISFGFRLTFSEPFFEGDAFIAFTLPGSSADIAGIDRGYQIIAINGMTLSGPNRDDALDLLYPGSVGESINIEVKPPTGPNETLVVSSHSLVFPPVEGAKTFSAEVSGSDDITVGYLQFNDHTNVAKQDLIDAFENFESTGIDELILDLRYNSGGLLDVANLAASMIASEADRDGKYFGRLNIPNPNADRNIFPENNLDNFIDSYLGEPIPQLNLERVFVLTTGDTCSASESLMNGLRGIGVEVVQIGTTTCGKPYGFYGFPSCGYTYLPVAFKSFSYMSTEDYDLGFSPVSTPTNLDIELDGCLVEDDLSQPLGNVNEGQLAAALGYIFDESCPPVFSTLSQTQSSLNEGASAHSSSVPETRNSRRHRKQIRNNMIHQSPSIIR